MLDDQLTFAPDSFTTLAHLSCSERTKAPNCADDCGRSSAPTLSRRSFSAGVPRTCVIAAWTLLTPSGGVFAGATRPWKDPVANPGRTAASATVGMSGIVG